MLRSRLIDQVKGHPRHTLKIPPYIPVYSLKGTLMALYSLGTQLEDSNKEETAIWQFLVCFQVRGSPREGQGSPGASFVFFIGSLGSQLEANWAPRAPRSP